VRVRAARSLGLVGVAVTSVALLLSGPAGADPPVLGVQFHGAWPEYTDADRDAVLDKLVDAGLRWVRIDLRWRSFEEKGPGELDEAYAERADKVVDAARRRGLEVLVTLLNTPAWANGGRPSAVPPVHTADFARFASCAAGHFRGRVAAWEVWNEPNHESFWAGADAGRYAALLAAAYPALKAGDPDATVVAGGVSKNDTPWLTRLYDAGAQGSFDVLSTHPYPDPSDAPPDLPDDGSIGRLDHLGAVRALMVGRGDAHKPIWLTEVGWSAHGTSRGRPPWKRGVTPSSRPTTSSGPWPSSGPDTRTSPRSSGTTSGTSPRGIHRRTGTACSGGMGARSRSTRP
jgi:hypothetical protein